MTIQLFSHGYRGDDRLNRLFADRARLWRPFAWLHALQTGLPDPREAPRRTTPLRVLGRDLTALGLFMTVAGVGAVAAGHLPASAGSAAGLVSAYAALGVIGRLRRLVVGHTHESGHCVVAQFYRSLGMTRRKAARLNEVILDAGSVISLTRNGLDYRRAHLRHHDELSLGTLRDPDGMDLHAWGLWPGLGQGSLKLDLLLTIVDPLWHLGMIASRLRSNLLVGTPRRRLWGLAMLTLLAGSALVLPLPAWIMAIGLPWTIGYNTAAVLQVLTEHPYGHDAGVVGQKEHADRNWERVPLEPFPTPSVRGPDRIRAWLGWGVKAALIHVPSRLAVLDDGMIGHGWHHMAWPLEQPFNDWWETSRRMLIARHSGSLPAEAATAVVYGLPEALDLQARRFRRSKA